jgi:hypothetical protein
MELFLVAHTFQRRHRMPRVRPPYQRDIVLGISFLDFADKFLIVPFNPLQVLIGKPASLLFQFTFELYPFLPELICIHRASSCVMNRCINFTLISDHHGKNLSDKRQPSHPPTQNNVP